MASNLRNKMLVANAKALTPREEINRVADNRDYDQENREAVTNNDEGQIDNPEAETVQENQTETQSKRAINDSEAIPVREEKDTGYQKVELPARGISYMAESAKTPEYEGMPYKGVGLIPQYQRFLRVRPKQLGYTKESFIEMLLKEEMEKVAKVEDLEKHYLQVYNICHRRYKEVKERTNIRFSPKSLEFLESETINSGISITTYLNYIIAKELEREEKEGKRPSIK